MKPDDVFTALNGETVEMLNSDAEGRMVLKTQYSMQHNLNHN